MVAIDVSEPWSVVGAAHLQCLPPERVGLAACGPIVLVWDRGRSHQHRLVRAWLATHPGWHIVWVPPYAPELNPVELLWAYLKYARLANLAPDTVDETLSTRSAATFAASATAWPDARSC